MVEIKIEIDDAIYEKFTRLCDILGKDAISFIQDRVTAEIKNHLKMLSEEFDTNV